MDQKKASEIAEKYPNQIECYPRGRFKEQLENFLVKYA